MAKPEGWKNEPARHALAAKGIKTKVKRTGGMSIKRGSGEYDTDMLEREVLHMIGHNELDSLDQLSEEQLDKIKCPHCGNKELQVWGKAEDRNVGTVDMGKREIFEEGFEPQEEFTFFFCPSCSKKFVNIDV